MCAFPRLPSDVRDLPVIAVDIGYSSSKRTCGVASSATAGAESMRFGAAVELAAELCLAAAEVVLVLEAVLSTYHNSRGNPEARGAFEQGRGWYHGPGAVTMIAAQRFLDQLSTKVGEHHIWLAEAFLSNDPARTHKGDAQLIARTFWSQPEVETKMPLDPISHLVCGVPPIRVFRHGA